MRTITHISLVLLAVILTFSPTTYSKIETSGALDIGIKWLQYPISQAEKYPVNDQLYQGEFKGSLDVNFSESVKFTGKVLYVSDPDNKSAEEQSSVELPEFNLKWKGETAAVKLGNEIYTWGITDGFNPLDFINTKIYFDPIHARKQGAPSLSMNFGGERFDMDLVYIPRALSSIMPGTNSRWLPRNIYVNSAAAGDQVKLILPSHFNYYYTNSTALDSALDNNAALRMQLHLGKNELAIYAYDGVAQMPLVKPYVSGTSNVIWPITVINVNSNVRLDLQDYRQRIGGLSASRTFGAWQLKGVGSWTQSYSGADRKQGWSNAAVAAAEKSWAPSVNSTLITIFQYSYCERQTMSGNDMTSIASFFDRNAMLGGQFMWKDSDTVAFFYSNDTLTQSSFADLNYEHRFTETFRMGIKGTSIDGSTSSPLGVYSDNKYYSLNLNWTL